MDNKWKMVLNMYVRSICPHCQKPSFHAIALHCMETTWFSDFDSATRYAVEYAEVKESITEEAIVRHVLPTIRRHLSDGIEVKELCKILKTCYGIAAAYCCDLIQRIKIELDMYSPDKKHLYFVYSSQ